MKALQYHPLADIFPLMEGKDFDELADDIAEHGLTDPITLDKPDGKIIDGRNRYRACVEKGVNPLFEVLPDSVDPVHFVLSRNVHRRHLNESQRAMVGTKLATLPKGRPAKSADLRITQEQAA